MIYEGVTCKLFDSQYSSMMGKRVRDRYAKIPLKWLDGLGGESCKVKVVALLWFLSAVNNRGWFRFSNKISREYGVSASQKNKILSMLVDSGHVELRRKPGKTVEVRLLIKKVKSP